MNEETKDKIKLAEGILGERMDGYLQEEIDSSIFPILTILDAIFQQVSVGKLKSTLTIVIDCLIQKGSLSKKEEQKINVQLNKIKNTFHHSDVADWEEEIRPMTNEILETIHGSRKDDIS